jgi:chromobox protein 1
MSKIKESPPTDNEGEEEFSVEKVLDRRVVKGKVRDCTRDFNFY